jgi:hypothetical protein
MRDLTAEMKSKSAKELRRTLGDKKKDFDLLEGLPWEAAENTECTERIKMFFQDLGEISRGQTPRRWKSEMRGNTRICIAQHITAE